MQFKKYIIASTLLIAGVTSLLTSCRSGGGKTSETTVDSSELAQNIFADISNAKQIFYSLPSPLESAMLIKSAGASFNEKLMNPVINASKYNVNKTMALNLGIYITDLSYASMFDQAQLTIKYMDVSKKMADGLGITEGIDQNTIDRLEENINNRDVILDIISETFMSSTAFLKESDRQPLATISLVGGWIEGLYLASQLVPNNVDVQENKIVARIVDQKFSLDMVMKLMSNNKDNKDIIEVSKQIDLLKKAYDKLIIKNEKVQTQVDAQTSATTLKGSSSSNITPEIFTELKETIKSIRTNFTL